MRKRIRIILLSLVAGATFALPVYAECWQCNQPNPPSCYGSVCSSGGVTGAADCRISVSSGCCILTGNCVPQGPEGIAAAGTLVSSGRSFTVQNVPDHFVKWWAAWESPPLMVASRWQADCKGRIVGRWFSAEAAAKIHTSLAEIHV